MFDRHYAVNVRASWLLVKQYAERFRTEMGSGRVVALTSDAVVGNLPYGSTKGALDRMIIASARELAHLRVSANVVNPGPVDTGWMSEDLRAGRRATLARATSQDPQIAGCAVSCQVAGLHR